MSSVDVYSIEQVTNYLTKLQQNSHPNTYRKKYFQLRRFLRDALELNYLDKVRLPRVTNPQVKVVTEKDIKNAIEYFSKSKCYLRHRAFILLMSSSGLRPSEAFQLTTKDIDLANRTIYVRHDSTHHVKIGNARITFFNEQTRLVLERYIKQNRYRCLWNASSSSRAWRHAPIKIKDMCKYFSQEFVRRGSNQAVKELLLGHSTNGSVDAMHYLALSEDDLKQIYDKVMK